MIIKNKFYRGIVIVIYFLSVNSCSEQQSVHNNSFQFTREVVIGDTLQLSINYVNNTSRVLKIKDVHFDCSCMSGSINKRIIKQNQSAIISFNTHISKYDSNTSKIIRLIDENGTEELIEIFIELNHKIFIKPYNRIIFMANSKIGQEIQNSFSISNNTGEELLIDSLSISNKSLKVVNSTLKNIILEPNKEKMINMSFLPTIEGVNESTLKIYLSHRATPVTLFIYSIAS